MPIEPLMFTEVSRLLDPAPMALEMGVEWAGDRILHVASRTDMPGCSGEMFEWWFRFAPDSEQYMWWHPVDHVASHWLDTNPETHIGSTHLAQERIGGPMTLLINIRFSDPAEIIDAEALSSAREQGNISGLIYAVSGGGEDPPRDEQGRPRGSRMLHVCRDVPGGMVLRSHWWMDQDRQDPEPSFLQPFIGLGLVRHSNTEFKHLAKFLPSLFAGRAERSDRPSPLDTPLPW